MVATDADSSVNPDGQISYAFSATYADFTLDSQTGKISLASSLDREGTQVYVLLVKATDGTTTVTATVSVNVQDDNDNDPQFTAGPYRWLF